MCESAGVSVLYSTGGIMWGRTIHGTTADNRSILSSPPSCQFLAATLSAEYGYAAGMDSTVLVYCSVSTNTGTDYITKQAPYLQSDSIQQHTYTDRH